MKKLLCLALCLCMILFSACGAQPPPPLQGNGTSPSENGVEPEEIIEQEDPPPELEPDLEETPDEPEQPEQPEEIDLSPLELIGGHSISENGDLILNLSFDEKCDIDTFRKYFFGTWQYYRGDNIVYDIIDDAGIGIASDFARGGFYRIGENVIFALAPGNLWMGIYWLDINDPDIMYW